MDTLEHQLGGHPFGPFLVLSRAASPLRLDPFFAFVPHLRLAALPSRSPSPAGSLDEEVQGRERLEGHLARPCSRQLVLKPIHSHW